MELVTVIYQLTVSVFFFFEYFIDNPSFRFFPFNNHEIKLNEYEYVVKTHSFKVK